MCRVKSCCFCVDLETGGKIWGYLSMVMGSSFLFRSAKNAYSGFQESAGTGIFYIISALVAIGFIYVSYLLVKGIEERNHAKIQPSRIVAIIGYVWMIANILLLTLTDIVKDELLVEVKSTGIEYKTDKDLDDAITQAKSIFSIIYGLGILFDFVFRFLVIDSLYHKYREEGKPRTMA